MTPALARLYNALQTAGCRPHRSGDGIKALCPCCQLDGKAHDPALSVSSGRERDTILFCHSGNCKALDVLNRLGLEWSDVESDSAQQPREVARWQYVDESGARLHDVVRYEPGFNGKLKDYRQYPPGQSRGRIKGIRCVIYRLPEVLAAIRDGWTLFLVEGEKCADAINGYPDADRVFASTNPMGAKAWRDEYADSLKGAANVIVWRDRDADGATWARNVATSLAKRDISHRIVESPHAHDAADHLDAGHALEDLTPVTDEQQGDEHDVDSLITRLSEATVTAPEFDAEPVVRRHGVHMWYGPPGNYKTYLALLMVLQQTQLEPGKLLFGVEGWTVRRRWKRVLWLGDEESAGELRHRAEVVARGHGLRPPDGDEILFADASGGAAMLDVTHIPQLVERTDADAVIADPLANLTPGTDEQGRPVKADLDNQWALRRVCRPMRRLAKQQDVSVFLLHHPNASGERERGPSAYRGSVDVLLRVALDGALVLLDCEKNRDGHRPRVHLDPVWTGHRESADEPLSLRLETTEGAPSETNLPPTAVKILAAIRASGPLTKACAFDAAPDVHRTTRGRALGLLKHRKLVEEQADGRYVACAEVCTE